MKVKPPTNPIWFAVLLSVLSAIVIGCLIAFKIVRLNWWGLLIPTGVFIISALVISFISAVKIMENEMKKRDER